MATASAVTLTAAANTGCMSFDRLGARSGPIAQSASGWRRPR